MQIHCPACALSTEHRRLFTKNGCDIFQCAACGLARADVSNFVPEEYYNDDYFSGGRTDGYGDYRGTAATLHREFARTVAFVRRWHKGGRLLEIGCAYGFFLDEAQAYFDVVGIEIADAAATAARDRGLNVITGIADRDTLAPLGTFDVIVMLDVIEHLPDPGATLALCHDHLASGGIVVITTGDISSLYARVAGPHWRLATPPQHLWYFTPESLRRLGRATGYRLESCDHPWKLVPLSLIGFQVRRMLGARQAQSGGVGHLGVPVNLFDSMRAVFRKTDDR